MTHTNITVGTRSLPRSRVGVQSQRKPRAQDVFFQTFDIEPTAVRQAFTGVLCWVLIVACLVAFAIRQYWMLIPSLAIVATYVTAVLSHSRKAPPAR